jgi:hypothetical protein
MNYFQLTPKNKAKNFVLIPAKSREFGARFLNKRAKITRFKFCSISETFPKKLIY